MGKTERKDGYVPFQLCPKCNGQGTVFKPSWYNTTTSTGPYPCDVCNGAKIIPMALVEIGPRIPEYKPKKRKK
jgi:DnaJ-class molecular chaperone